MLPKVPYDLTGVSNDILFQAYCLNPPSDSCTYGPCPNPDVTGVGQQVSRQWNSRSLSGSTLMV